MFIKIIFGYKQFKIFTGDVLTATLMDCIWETCFQEIKDLIKQKKESFTKEQTLLVKRIQRKEEELSKVELQIQQQQDKEAAEAAQNQEQDNKKKKKDDKKGKASKKGKEQAPEDGLEKDKYDIEQAISEFKEFIEQYKIKVEKLEQQAGRYDQYEKEVSENEILVELLDTEGGRKFTNNKRTSFATEILADQCTYVLSLVRLGQTEGTEDEIYICDLDGSCIRNCEEDKTAPPDEPLVVLAKDDKKKKKGGKK